MQTIETFWGQPDIDVKGATIRRAIDPDRVSGQGAYCKFYRITSTIGVKTYKRLTDRDDSLRCQTIMHKAGIAPATYGSFDFVDGGGNDRYAYVTEIVEILRSDGCFDKNSPKRAFDELPASEQESAKLARERLKIKFNRNGFSDWDLHWGNVGWNKDKTELICIDCAGCVDQTIAA